MIRDCCYCNKILGEKEPLEDKRITSGICPECLETEIEKIESKKRDEAIVSDNTFVDAVTKLQEAGYRIRTVTHFSPAVKHLTLERR